MNTRTLVAGKVALCLLASLPLQAAEQMTRFDSKPGNLKVRIEGTSSIHNWRMQGSVIGGYLEAGPGFPIEPGQAAKPGKIEATVNAFIPVGSLKSLKENGTPYSDPMDRRAYEAMKQKDFPQIRYRLNDLVLKEAAKAKDAPYVFEAKGELAVAGVTNKISVPVNITPLGDKKLKITGETSVKMTAFGIEPPSPTGLGLLIKTGDEVKLMFEWTVAQKAPASSAAK